MGIKAALPKYEISTYYGCAVSCMFWSTSWIFGVSVVLVVEGTLSCVMFSSMELWLLIMRCMSFALEGFHERKDGNYSILELLKYNFYLPCLLFRAHHDLDKFYVQANKSDPDQKERELWNISLQGPDPPGELSHRRGRLFHFMHPHHPTDMEAAETPL
ncbi:hedgehog acyltransferase like, b isoform X1 [Lates japonicus]|uniref:Hedgehog acyltransferase like, b isoform X1 n=1 Tax=Lates japonicus TaxID=270547 RepID=A0AAD3MJS4_LATJO|nr:hedgehog acyltransferase like, b isoform X1 [Lates japonicus]